MQRGKAKKNRGLLSAPAASVLIGRGLTDEEPPGDTRRAGDVEPTHAVDDDGGDRTRALAVRFHRRTRECPYFLYCQPLTRLSRDVRRGRAVARRAPGRSTLAPGSLSTRPDQGGAHASRVRAH